MALPQLTTSQYSADARARLGRQVTRAREAAGWARRQDFAAHASISLRSLAKLEQGEPGVGRRVLDAVGRALPHWTEDTPRDVLEGQDAPTGAPPPPPVVLTPEAEEIFTLIDGVLKLRGLRMTPRMLMVMRDEIAVQIGHPGWSATDGGQSSGDR